MVLPFNERMSCVNLSKLHRKIEHNEKVCRAQEFGSYAQGQGHNQVRGKRQSRLQQTTFINILSLFFKESKT